MTGKKIYSKPLLQVHSLDKEICLVMVSLPPDNPPGVAPPPSEVILKSESPFGGDRPVYK